MVLDKNGYVDRNGYEIWERFSRLNGQKITWVYLSLNFGSDTPFRSFKELVEHSVAVKRVVGRIRRVFAGDAGQEEDWFV
jgi:hypothetical protein